MFCPKCGKNVIEGSAFCANCGASLQMLSQQGDAASAVNTVIPVQESAPTIGEVNEQITATVSTANTAPQQSPVQELPNNAPPQVSAPIPPVYNAPPQGNAQIPPAYNVPPQGNAPIQPDNTVSQYGAAPTPNYNMPAAAGYAVPVQQAPKRKSPAKALLIIGISLIAVAGIVILVFMLLGNKNYTVNKTPTNDIIASAVRPAGSDAYNGDGIEVSFLYPASAAIRTDLSDGIYLYPSGAQGLPYIMISRVNTSSDPEKYFAEYQKQMNSSYSSPDFDDIRKVEAGEKTLYMQRMKTVFDGVDQVIDRYIEVYSDCTVTYTVKSLNAGSEDDFLKNVILSLYPVRQVYGNAAAGTPGSDIPANTTEDISYFPDTQTTVPDTSPQDTMPPFTTPSNTSSQDTTTSAAEPPVPVSGSGKKVSAGEIALTVTVPDGLKTEPYENGIAAYNDDLIFIAEYQNTNYCTDAVILNAADYIDQWSKSASFINDQLGFSNLTYSGYEEVTIDGKSGMMLTDVSYDFSDFTGKGRMYILTENNYFGTYVLYYAVTNGAANAAALEAAGKAMAESFTMKDAPYSENFMVCNPEDGSFMFFVDTALIGTPSAVERGVDVPVGNLGADHKINVRKNDFSSQGVTDADSFLRSYAEQIGVSSSQITEYGAGRYGAKCLTGSYTENGASMQMEIVAFNDSNGIIYTIYGEDTETNFSAYDDIIYQIVWSIYVG
ncbi:MAG: zinc-ribbon domain-containing protein [Ruminiclostridium sp.]|nr:zinc-ribbon domain-containing protein [Ruminiclostridium sp.]